MVTVNPRVGCIQRVDGHRKVVYFLGWGTLKTEELPTGKSMTCSLLRDSGVKTQRIQIGRATIWGCDCYWGYVEDIQNELDSLQKLGYTVVRTRKDGRPFKVKRG